jgi:DNA-binding transcriptional MerR regulator
MSDEVTLTLGAVSKGSGLCDSTIRTYVRLGLLTCRFDSTGRRLFTPDAPAVARQIHAKRQERQRTRSERSMTAT